MKERGADVMAVLRAARAHERDLVARLAKSQTTTPADTAAMKHADRRGRGGKAN